MDIEIVRPGTESELRIFLVDKDGCRLVTTYRFHLPDRESVDEARNNVADWLNTAEIRTAILEQLLATKKTVEKTGLTDAEPAQPARRYAKSWKVLARVNIDEFLQGLS